MRTLRISVRRLVEFLLRSGDIDAESEGRGSIEAMQAGSNIHRMLQAAGGEAYQAEVPLASSLYFPGGSFSPHAARLDIREEAVHDQGGFFLRVEGRADGIIDDGTHPLVVDEIKGVMRDVSDIDEPIAVHEAQALCYAYLYLRGTQGASAISTAFGRQVVVRLTYASMTTGEVRQIEHTYDLPGIEARFFTLLEAAQRWAAWRVAHDELRQGSLRALAFPLRPRSGQQELMDAVAAAIRKGTSLYVQAPTGSGKTIATLYPALKAMGSGETSRIAFLTAKTMTRRAALECLDLFRQQDFAATVLVVTARDKICPLRSRTHGADMRARPLASLCNPIECPYARGHYDAVNDALYEAITSHDVLDSAAIRQVAARHHVCPYELQRDAARWADVIVCDYHFAFAPSASLLGLTDEPGGADTVFLVDEAHNLVERMREMYSAELAVASLRELERLLRATRAFGQLLQAVHAAITAFPTWEKALPTGTDPITGRRAKRPVYQRVRWSDAFAETLASRASMQRSNSSPLPQTESTETARRQGQSSSSLPCGTRASRSARFWAPCSEPRSDTSRSSVGTQTVAEDSRSIAWTRATTWASAWSRRGQPCSSRERFCPWTTTASCLRRRTTTRPCTSGPASTTAGNRSSSGRKSVPASRSADPSSMPASPPTCKRWCTRAQATTSSFSPRMP